MQFENQIQRIREKLIIASQRYDQDAVFGASSHEYQLGDPVSEQQLIDFETQTGISVPEAYRAFLLHIGNGGAGPYYGLYELANFGYMSTKAEYLAKPFILYPEMSADEWREMTRFYNDDTMPEEELNVAYDRIFQGAMPIGTQGCSYHTLLIMNGEYRGRVLYIDTELQPPFFTYENNFLDWYERWLDEVIAGYSIDWFGMNMGGDDLVLTEKFHNSTRLRDKTAALSGMFKLPDIHEETIYFLAIQCEHGEPEVKKYALYVLTRFAYAYATPFLKKAFESQDDTEILTVAQSVYWYAKQHSSDWAQPAEKALPYVLHEETFRFVCYVLQESNHNYAASLIPFFYHPIENIQATAIYAVGRLGCDKKEEFLRDFIHGLNHPSNYIKHTTLQALYLVTVPELLPYYERIILSYQKDEEYILTNVLHRLNEMGNVARPLLEKTVNHADEQIAARARKLLGQIE